MRFRWTLPALAALAVLAAPLPSGSPDVPARGEAHARTPHIRSLVDIRTGWRSPVRAVVVDPAGQLLAAGGDAGEVILYDIQQRKVRLRLSARGAVTALALSPDGKRLAVGWKGRFVELVDPGTGRVLRRLGPLRGWPMALAFSPKGDRLAVAGRAQQIALFDVATGRAQGLLTGHTSWVNDVAFSPDGRRIAGAGWDHAVRIWDAQTGKLLRSGYGHRYAVDAVVFTRDGQRVISASDDQSMRVFKVSSGVALKRVRGPAILCLARAARADVVVAGTFHGKLLLLREEQLHPRRVLKVHRGAVFSVALSADGRVVVTGGRDGWVRVWQIR